MAIAAIIEGDSFEVGFLRGADNKSGKAQQLVDLNRSYRKRTLEMGGGSGGQGNSDALRMMVGNAKILTLCGEALSHNDNRSREQKLKIDMTRAFGSEIGQMGAFITEILQSLGEGSPLSQDRKDQLFEMVTEIVTLKNLTNIGVHPEGQAILEARIAETANKIADVLIEGMDHKAISPAIAEFVQNILVETRQNFDIPTLDDKLVKIEGRMNPEQYLSNSTLAMIAELSGLLKADDLSDESKADIEAMIEAMETSLENGEPISREIMQALDNFAEAHTDIPVLSGFATTLETLQDANIVMKAESLGVSVAQIQSVESSIEALEGQLQAMGNEGEATAEDRAEIEALIEKLENFADEGVPLDRESLQVLETLTEKHADIGVAIAPVLDTLKEANTIVKADVLGISVEQMQAIEATVDTLDGQLQTLLESGDYSEEAKAEIEALIEKLEVFVDEGTPLDRETLQSLETLVEANPDLNFEAIIDANTTIKADTLGISVEQMQAIEATVDTLDGQLQTLLESGDYSEEAKAEIEALLEKIEAFADEGTPLDRETLQSLETLVEANPDLNFEAIIDANTALRAEELGVSFEQMRQIETSIDGLDSKLQSLLESENYTDEQRAEIEALMEKIEAFKDEGIPLDPETVAVLENLKEQNPDLDIDPRAYEIPEPAAPADPDKRVDLHGDDTPQPIGFEPTDTPREPEIDGPDDAPNPPSENPPEGDMPDIAVNPEKDVPSEAPEGPEDDEPEPPVPDPEEVPDDVPDNPDKDLLQDPEDKPDDVPTDEGDKPDSNPDKGPDHDGEPDKPIAGPDETVPDTPTPLVPPPPPVTGDIDTKPEPAKDDAKREVDGPKKPCGDDCQCAKKFNQASRNDDGSVTMKLTNGEEITVSNDEAKQLIEKEISDNFQLDDTQWKNTLDQFEGDQVKAFEYLNEQRQKETEFTTYYVGPSTNLDGQESVDLIAEQMRKMGGHESHSHPNDTPTAKGPWEHVCIPGVCDHGAAPANKNGHKSGEIDITALGSDSNHAETGEKKKTKKTKTPKP